ncbi:hypothetical protein GCM10008097_05830 [Mycetocola manganoxydans]|nr:hypothetical protein GCM10008097_05830 [Mycetocola manganoxydans]
MLSAYFTFVRSVMGFRCGFASTRNPVRLVAADSSLAAAPVLLQGGASCEVNIPRRPADGIRFNIAVHPLHRVLPANPIPGP